MRTFRKGFTLIEVLASVAILMILVLIISQVYKQCISAWGLGTRRAQDNLAGRTLMDMILRDLSQAVADSNLSFRLDSADYRVFGPGDAVHPYAWSNDALYFVSFIDEPAATGNRTAREVIYYAMSMDTNEPPKDIGRYCLRRVARHNTTCYQNREWWKDQGKNGAETVAENIASLEIWCYGASNKSGALVYTNVPYYNTLAYYDAGTPALGTNSADRGYEYQKLPYWVEVYFSMLDEDAAIKASELFKAGQYGAARKFVERNEKRYVGRAFFQNRVGYTGLR